MSLYSDPFLHIPAWTDHTAEVRYPLTGSYSVCEWSHVGGVIGLDPSGAVSHGVLTFLWTMDEAGDQIVGVQGINISSQIVSLNQLRIIHQGPYLHLTYQPFVGANPLAATLFNTTIGSPQPELAGDTILIDEKDRPLAAQTSEAIYPCDYFAGQVRVYLGGPATLKATLYGADLTDQFWPLDIFAANVPVTTIVPLGSWMIVVSNPTPAAATYTLAVTPRVG